MESLLVKLRSEAMQQQGYVSGETLKSIDDPSIWLVMSTWVNADLWKAWETTGQRREVVSKIEPLLVAPEKVSIFSFTRRGGAKSAHTIDE